MSETNRRAKLRGRGAVAQWRISGAVWAGRIFAALVAIGAVTSLLSRNPDARLGGVIILVLAGIVLLASWGVSRGSRPAAVALLVLYLLAKLSSWKLGDESPWAGAIWSLILLGAFGNGIWGTFELAAIARESEALAQALKAAPPESAAVSQAPADA